jgi:hypothetical protein
MAAAAPTAIAAAAAAWNVRIRSMRGMCFMMVSP